MIGVEHVVFIFVPAGQVTLGIWRPDDQGPLLSPNQSGDHVILHRRYAP
jgi:hypothetical protein